MAKKTYEEVKACFEENGCVLLEDNYVNNSTKMRFICSCGNHHSITWGNFISGKRCRECGKPNRPTYEQLKEIYDNAGCELLSEYKEYTGCRAKLQYKCKCGKIETKTFTNFKSSPKCLTCSGLKRWAKKHPSIEEVQLHFKEQGCVLLSTAYVNSSEKLNYICKCGNTHKISYASFKKGVRCWDCGRKKLVESLTASMTDLKTLFSDNGCQLLSQEYSPRKKLEYIAQCGHKSTINLYDFNQGAGIYCVKCVRKNTGSKLSHDINFVKKYFRDNGCELLESSYKSNSTKMRYKCECGNEAYITFASFKRGSRCQHCKIEKLSVNNRRYTLADVKEIFKERGCVLLETEYRSTKQLLRYKCNCGNTSKIRLTNFKDQGNGCLECRRIKLSGANNYNWKPDLTDEEREKNKSRINLPEVSRWRRAVFKRDNFTCQCCGRRKSGTLNAHHLDGWNWCTEKRTDVDNGITLCVNCHVEFHSVYGNGDNTREQYEEWIQNKHEQGA